MFCNSMENGEMACFMLVTSGNHMPEILHRLNKHVQISTEGESNQKCTRGQIISIECKLFWK